MSLTSDYNILSNKCVFYKENLYQNQFMKNSWYKNFPCFLYNTWNNLFILIIFILKLNKKTNYLYLSSEYKTETIDILSLIMTFIKYKLLTKFYALIKYTNEIYRYKFLFCY